MSDNLNYVLELLGQLELDSLADQKPILTERLVEHLSENPTNLQEILTHSKASKGVEKLFYELEVSGVKTLGQPLLQVSEVAFDVYGSHVFQSFLDRLSSLLPDPELQTLIEENPLFLGEATFAEAAAHTFASHVLRSYFLVIAGRFHGKSQFLRNSKTRKRKRSENLGEANSEKFPSLLKKAFKLLKNLEADFWASKIWEPQSSASLQVVLPVVAEEFPQLAEVLAPHFPESNLWEYLGDPCASRLVQTLIECGLDYERFFLKNFEKLAEPEGYGLFALQTFCTHSSKVPKLFRKVATLKLNFGANPHAHLCGVLAQRAPEFLEVLQALVNPEKVDESQLARVFVLRCLTFDPTFSHEKDTRLNFLAGGYALVLAVLAQNSGHPFVLQALTHFLGFKRKGQPIMALLAKDPDGGSRFVENLLAALPENLRLLGIRSCKKFYLGLAQNAKASYVLWKFFQISPVTIKEDICQEIAKDEAFRKSNFFLYKSMDLYLYTHRKEEWKAKHGNM